MSSRNFSSREAMIISDFQQSPVTTCNRAAVPGDTEGQVSSGHRRQQVAPRPQDGRYCHEGSRVTRLSRSCNFNFKMRLHAPYLIQGI